MEDLEAVFNEEFNHSRQCLTRNKISCPSKLARDLLDVFNDMFDQSSTRCPSSNVPTIIQDPDDPNEAEGDCVGSDNSEGFLFDHEDEGEEQESELELDRIQISDGEEIVDTLIEVDSRDGYVTLVDNVSNVEHSIPRSRADKAKRVLSLRSLIFVVCFAHPDLRYVDRQVTSDFTKGPGGFGCTCKRKCGKAIPLGFVVELRARLLSCPSEQEVSEMVISWLSMALPPSSPGGYLLTDGNSTFPVCGNAWYGVCKVCQ